MQENKKGEEEKEKVAQISLSSQVLILEKELKNDKIHKSLITGIRNLNDGEFITCGIENAFKVWDTDS